jgi:autotransporter-associated beta strand protein
LSAAVTIGVGNPTLVSIADNVTGGPVTVGQPVNFTVTFDEAINASTITAADFENGSTAGIIVNSVSATVNPAVFTVAVTTTAPGNLNLRIKAGAVIEDLDASPLNTTSPLPDNTTIAVNALAGPSLLSIADNVSGGPVAVGVPVNFTVTFNEAINAATIGTDDFENASSAGITVDSVSATGNPAVFTVAVTTTSAGALTLQIKAGAVIQDLDSFTLNTTSALPDNTTISVKSTSAPILLTIADNVPGGSVVEGAPVSYTVTFDEAINATTLGVGDFENASTADITVNSVTATANPAVFTVAVTTNFRGDLTLQIKAAAVIEDLAGFALDTTSALPDDDIITVTSSPPPTLLSISDNVSGGPVTSGGLVNFTVTFDKAINAATLGTNDFENGSSAGITVNSVSATANPAIFTVAVTTTFSGTLNLRIKAGAVIEDLYGLPLNTVSALPDNTSITVTSAPAVLYWDDNGNGADFGTAGANTGTWAAPTAGPTAGWSLSNTGANAFAVFNTGTTDSLNFGNGATGLGAGTINVSGTVGAGNMTFASGSGAIVLSGGTINLAAAQTITVNNATNTISSVLSGAATSFTKAGTGTLVLTQNNTYTGTTSVSAGTLILSNANTISGATSVVAAGTLQLGHATSMGTSTMTLASGATLQLRNDANTTFTAPIATPAGAVTYNFDVNQATVAGTAKTLTRGNITFATSTANTINVTGGNSYTLGLGTLSSPSGTGGPWAFTVNATTAAVTIANFSAGSFGNALALQGGNAITLSNFEMGSNSTNSLTVSGSGTIATLGSTTQTNNRAGGSVAYTLTSGTLNITTTTSLANTRAASGTLTAPTFAINGGTLNNTSGSALTLAASPGTGTIAGSPTITLGGNFAFGTALSTSTNNLNLGTGAITNAGNRTITLAGTGSTLTMGGVMTNTSGANQTTTVNGAGNTLSLGGYSLSNSATNRVNVINGSGNVTISGAVTNGSSAASGLTYSGTGTLTLSAMNTFAGAVNINSGTLAISSTGLLTNSTAGTAVTTVNSGGNLSVYAWQYGLTGSIGNPFFGPSTLIVNGGTITYTGVGENSGNNNGRVFAIGTNGATLNAAGTGTWFITRNAGSPLDQTTINGLTLTGSGNGRYSNILAGTGGRLTKSGSGTWTLAGVNTYTGTTTVNQGTLTLGVDNALSNSSNMVIGAGTLSADTNVDDTAGTLDVTATATINLGSAATLAFANSAAVDWTGGTLNVNGTLGATSLRFGTNNTGLSPAQLAVISVNNTGLGTYTLDGLGYLVAGGPGPLDRFAISAISSPQTVGMPITGITLTAQDAANATVTSFTGTVTFGGTGGFSGTSATFTAGVLSGVSVIPTNAGSALTLTVTDIGSGKTGSATITTIQTQFTAWSGGALFADDANNDGVDNGLAFLLGASGPNVDATALLPNVTQSGGNLVLEFDCLTSAERGLSVFSLQHSADLGLTDAWANALVPGAVGISTVNGVDFVVTDPGLPGGLLRVVATVPASQASLGKLFGRLQAVE